jgi:hypothetical protein
VLSSATIWRRSVLGRRKGNSNATNADEPVGPFDRIEAITSSEGPRSPEVDRQIRDLRAEAGLELLASASGIPALPEPDAELPPASEISSVPEISPADLTPGLLRAAILQYGCVLIRGLTDSSRAAALRKGIDAAFDAREAVGENGFDGDAFYDEISSEPPRVVVGRPWVEGSGGVFGGDSPRVLSPIIECFAESGLTEAFEGYMGEPVVISAEKCTLRRTTADLPKAWHQDGTFMGVRALNVWLSLSHCGDVAPGLDIVPRRIEQLAESGGEGSIIDIEVLQEDVERLAGDAGISRPIFEPGDALIFDELVLHQTGSDPAMTETRYAIECWFFGRSAFPSAYVPIAV